MDLLLDNPALMMMVVVALLIFVGVPVLLILQPKKHKVPAFIFDRNREFEYYKCDVAAGIATYKRGGFAMEPTAVIPYVHGGSKLELGRPENRKATSPIFAARVGDTGCMQPRENKFFVQPISRPEYHRREAVIAEMARNEAQNKLSSIDLINVGLIVAIVILAIPLAAIGLRMAQQ
jgi:hypothetical protein